MRRLLMLALALAACSDGAPSTAVVIRLDAEGTLRTRIEEVAIEVTGEQIGGGDETRDLDDLFRTNAGAWPLVTAIAPKDGAAGRAFRFQAIARGGGDVLGRVQVSAAFVQGERVEVVLRFTEDCETIACEPDESCEPVAGVSRCVPAMRELEPARDGGLDAGPTILPTEAVTLRWPPHGHYTGSPLGSSGAGLRPMLRWEPAVGATDYSVAFFDCENTPVADCSFPMDDAGTEFRTGDADLRWRPEVPLAISEARDSDPVGARFLWRVAACNGAGCGPWSEARYLNVGRQPSDFDGDGFADLAIGDPDATFSGRAEAGAVTIVRGSDPALGGEVSDLGGNELSERFGAALAAGDFDGDGFGDVAVGAPGPGVVRVYFGSNSGLGRGTEIGPGTTAADSFGASLDCPGDVDGDGFDDLVVGWTGGGGVAVFRGSSTGLGTIETIGVADGEDTTRPFAVGDVNGDGLVDLLVGLPASGDQSGEAHLFLSEPPRSSIDGLPLPIPHPDEGIAATNSFFGGAATGGDFDDDGFADLAIAAHGWDGARGRVYLQAGAAGGLTGEWTFIDGTQARAEFGGALATGGAMGGPALLAVGEPERGSDDSAEGRVVLYQGTAGTGVGGTGLPLPYPGGSAVGSPLRFGAAIAFVDLDGDSLLELVVGAPAPKEAFLFETPMSEAGDIPSALNASDAETHGSSFAP